MGTEAAQVADRVASLVADRVPLREQVTADARIRELGLDSVAVMDLVMAVEDEFDVAFPLDRLAEVETVDDLARVVRGLVDQRIAAQP